MITLTGHWLLKKNGYSDVEIRGLSNGEFQMLATRNSRGDERWSDLKYSSEEILEYIQDYGVSLWE